MLFISQSAISQVKKQFKDEIFAQTTVIVKEDDANDDDILNGLDLDDIGMGEQIRITTELEKPTTKAIERIPEEKTQATKKAKKPATKKVVIPIDNSSKSSNLAGVVKKSSKSTDKAIAKKSTKSLKSTNKKLRKKKKRVKRKRKRIKRKRRKKFKKKYSCFRF